MVSLLIVTCLVAQSPDAPEPPAPGFLTQALAGSALAERLDRGRITVGGWSEASFTASTARSDQLPLGFNYLANDFLLNQHWLRIERSVDAESGQWDWGFRVDTILPGTDYRYSIARGLWDRQLRDNSGQPATYGIDPVQFYGQFAVPGVGQGLDVKVGRFFAQFGVESIDTTLNPFVSRSYTFIFNPFTHTGVFTSLKLSDTWSVQNGLVTGSDVFIDPASNPTYLGGIKWAPTEGKTTATLAVILGRGTYDASEEFHNPQVFDLVITHKFGEKLTYSLDALYGYTRDVPGIGLAQWLGVVNYLGYQVSDSLVVNSRLEFFDDCDGQRTGFAGLYTALTAGVAWKPKDWLIVRPEVRVDHNEAKPFEGKAWLGTAALDTVVKW